MDNSQDLRAGRPENLGVNETETIGVEQAEHEINHQEEESGDAPELYQDGGMSNEDDEKEEVMMDESNVESSKELRYNLRDKCTRSYKHLYDPGVFQIEDNDDNKHDEAVMVTANDAPEDTPQMSMKQGLRMCITVKKEMQQLHDRKVMQPINQKDLTPAQKQEALGYLMFLKKKRSGTVKGRGYADGHKQ